MQNLIDIPVLCSLPQQNKIQRSTKAKNKKPLKTVIKLFLAF